MTGNEDIAHAAAHHLQKAGFQAEAGSWGGSQWAADLPIETGHGHSVSVFPEDRGNGYNLAVYRHPEDPRESNSGGALRIAGTTHPYGQHVAGNPSEVPGHVKEFLRHPGVVKAIADDVMDARIKGVHPPGRK